MNRLNSVILVSFVLLAGCTDTTAVQKFAQSASTAAQFHSLALDYPGLLEADLKLETVEFNVALPPAQAHSNTPPALDVDAKAFCAALPALDKLHAAIVVYMNELGAVASTGSSSGTSGAGQAKPVSGGTAAPANPSVPTNPSVPAKAPGAPANPSVPANPAVPAKAPAAPCPPTVMPVSIATSSGSPAAAAAQAAGGVTATTLSSDLQKLDKAVPGLKITTPDANAAAGLIILLQDVFTAASRETAVREALQKGQQSFPSALKIERAVISAVQVQANGYADDMQAQLANAAQTLNAPQLQTTGLLRATRLLLAINDGQLITPAQANAIAAAASDYVTILDGLDKAFTTLSQNAANSKNVLTAATWNDIQPILSDVENAYSTLSKL